jgi:dGTPase
MSGQRDVVRALVEAYAAAPEERLDVAFRLDHEVAPDDGERLRVVVDQVASLTDVRALALHRQWCR